MPLRTGATAQLDAPEAVAVAALIAAAPANAHALGGVSHDADTLANLNTKLSDATLLALAGQLGGSAATPDIRGIRETSGPSLLTLGAIADTEFLKRVGSTVVGAAVASRQVSDEVIIRASPSAPPPSEITSGDLIGFELIDGAVRAVLGDHVKPVKFDLAVDPVLDIHFVVSNPGAGAGNVRFQLLVRYIDNGELTTKVVDETLLLTKAVVNTLNEHHTVGFTLDKTKISATDHHISFKLERLGADGLDTFDGDIAVLTAAQLQFTRGS